MTEQPTPTYAAQLTLTLPGAGPSATVTVTLAPADAVPLGSQTKPLADLTLAELRAYADELEADAWDAYQAITLLQLQEEADVEIEVRPLDESGQAGAEVEDWLGESIVLLASRAAETPAEDTATDEPPAPTAEPEAAEPAAATPQPAAAVAEPQPVAATEPTPAPPEKSAPATIETPNIIPSQARVRVAGGRLPLAYSGGAAVDILLDEAPLRAMQAHALSSLDREVAGVMVDRQPEKYSPTAATATPRHRQHHRQAHRHARGQRYLYARKLALPERHPVGALPRRERRHGRLVSYSPRLRHLPVGHGTVHPLYFFTQIRHVAYVLDPRARTSGFFSWNRQRTKVNRYDFMWPEWAAGSW